jgi:hypothetical protein
MWFISQQRVEDGGKVFLQKGKAIPLQIWTGPEDSRRLRLPNFKTIST